MFCGMPELELVGLEDTAVRYGSVGRMNRVEVCQVGQLRDLRNPTKQGTVPTLPTFFVMFCGMPELEFVGLEDTALRYESA